MRLRKAYRSSGRDDSSTESSCEREKRRETTFGQFLIHILLRYNFSVEIEMRRTIDHFSR